MFSLRSLTLTLATLLASANASHAEGDGVTLRELVRIMRQSYDAVENSKVRFTAERLDVAPDAVVEKFDIAFINRGSDMFAKVNYFSRDFDPPDWFLEESLWINRVQVRHPRRSGAHVVISDDAINPDFGANWYVNHIFRPYTEAQCDELSTTDYWLPYALENFQQQYSIAGTETINGVVCVKIVRETTDRHDAIWIATEKGGCVMRREISWANEGRETCAAAELAEYLPGVWLPKRLERRIERRPFWAANQWDANSEGSKLVIHVKSLELNCVSNEDFIMDFPHGTHIFDTIRNIHYPITTDATFDFHEGLQLAFGDLNGPPRDRRRKWWLLLANIVVLAILLALAVWKHFVRGGRHM